MCFAVVSGRKYLALIAGILLIKILQFSLVLVYIKILGWIKYSRDVVLFYIKVLG